MNKKDIDERYGHLGQKTRIHVQCECGRPPSYILKERALTNCDNHDGVYMCRSCAMAHSHKVKPRGKATHQKQREGRIGKRHSDETRRRMAEIKIDFYQTPEGKKVRKTLSRSTAQQVRRQRPEKYRIRGLYKSAKTGEVIAYNSSYELRYAFLLDTDPKIASYDCQIYYEVEDRGRSLDFLICTTDGRLLAREVKPISRMSEDAVKSQLYDSAMNAQANGWEFGVITEKDLGLSIKEIFKWAVEYRKQENSIDVTEHYQERDREKAKKHYRTKIATDKVEIWCDYCQETHEPLRLTYERNIEDNKGQYVCERMGGYIAGSKPKLALRKENPYAEQGMKQCAGTCKRILPFESFGVENSRWDGRARICKECRAAKATEAYQKKKGNSNEQGP